ncbi:hypothetical protein GALL_491530 [mine drainage metagenome]|uniref:Uncharacterized protein n=1 Tax=mine drainage metagenome TaxID=410659 RepID=A0A1J5PC62_9ZZZZ
MHRVEIGMQRRRHQTGEHGHIAAAQRAKGGGDFGAGRNVRFECVREFIRIVGEYQTGGQKLHQIRKLAVILRHQRIGRRYRAERNPRIQRAERDQRVVDRIAGKDENRLLGRKIAREQAGGDMPARGQ